LKLWPVLALSTLLAGPPAAAFAQAPRAPMPWPRVGYPTAGESTRTLLQAFGGARPRAAPSTRSALTPDSTRIPATMWKAGALLGGGLLGALGAATGVQLACYDGPCHNRLLGGVIGFALGGVIGFGLGALIGGQFPAPSP